MQDVRRLPVGEDNEIAVTLDDLAREGARRMIAAALRAEADEYVAAFAGEIDEHGKRLVVRNGQARERRVTVGSGTVPIRAPRVNDERVDEAVQRRKFSSTILPAYARRSPKVTDVLPILYLRGLSTGDFQPALRDLLGEDASGLSSSSIQRLTETWQADHAAFKQRQLGFHRYASLFLDGVHVEIRLGEDDKLCLLVVIGVREDGVKELLAVEDGYRESTESWAVVLRDLKDRGLNEPKLVCGDGALGAWAALRDVYPNAGRQQCWVHKTANVLDALPKRLQPRAKTLLHEMAEAPSREGRAAALPLGVRRQVPQGRRQARSRLEAPDRVLRLPRRALAPPQDDQPDREQLRDRQATHPRHQGRRQQEGGAGDGLQAADRRPRALATLHRTRAGRRRPQRREVQGRHPSHRRQHQPRRDGRREGRRLSVFTPCHPQHLTVARDPAP
jgi:putative transposase